MLGHQDAAATQRLQASVVHEMMSTWGCTAMTRLAGLNPEMQLGNAAGVQRAQILAMQAWMLVLLTHWSSKDLAHQRLGLEAGLLRYSL